MKDSDKELEDIFSYSNEVKKRKDLIRSVIKTEIKTRGKNDSQKDLIRSIKDNEITICSGIAGSGKTYVTLSQALRLLKQENSKYVNLYLIKSITPLKNEELGALPGDIREKIDPYMMSFYSNIEKIIGIESLNKLLDEGIIKPTPLAYLRGVTLDNAIVIADESQNITIGSNIKTIMTRVGQNSRLIILGDEKQVDLKKANDSSLKILMNNFGDINGIGVVRMNPNDTNIRNPMITLIENRFDEIELANEPIKQYHKNNKKIIENEKIPINGSK